MLQRSALYEAKIRLKGGVPWHSTRRERQPSSRKIQPSLGSKKTGSCTYDNAKLQRMISERAYYLWQEWGKPDNKDWEIWLQAEKDIYSQVKK